MFIHRRLASVVEKQEQAGMSYTLVATAKNEGPYLLEWVAYHRAIGFDNILIFQNDSTDYTHEILRVLDELGIVSYRYNKAVRGRHQVRAYKRAARQDSFRNSDWAIALDLDEFLQIHAGDGHLDDLFAALPEVDEVLLNWRRFGNDGNTQLLPGLVTERFQKAEPDERVTTRLTPYKAMFRPTHFHQCGVHRPNGLLVPEEGIRTCNGSGLMLDEFERLRFRATDPAGRRLAQINHYIVRDAASFVLKSDRGSAHQADRGIDKMYWKRRNFNDERDDSLAKRSDEIIAAMADLNQLSAGRLNHLRDKALSRHLDRFSELLDVPVYKELFEFCAGDRKAA